MKNILLLFSLLLIITTGFSQKTLEAWSELDDKKWSKKLTFNSYLGNLKRYVKSADQLPKMERVGLLSYYMFTPSPTQRNINLLSPAQLTDKGSSYLVDELFSIGYPGLESGFKEKGVSLALLKEFLDTEEKMSLYNTTNFEPSALGKGTASWAARLSGRAFGGDAKASPDGYRIITEANWDIKLMRKLGDFAQEVGVDAVICVQHQISWNGKDLYFGPLIMSIVGPNPVPENEDDWYAPAGPLKGYLEGFIYGAVIVNPPDAYGLGSTSKKGIEINFENIDLIYNRTAQSLIDYVNEEIGKLYKQ